MTNLEANPPLITPLVSLNGYKNIFIKDETLQTSAAFKYRGAYAKLSKVNSTRDVVAASTGNHGIAIAHVAAGLGRRAHIFVPAAIPRYKVQRLYETKAKVTIAGHHLDESAEQARSWARLAGAAWISGFDDIDVVDGYRGLFRELDVFEPERIIVPIGGGGLFAAALLEYGVKSEVIGVQSEASTSLEKSLELGRPTRVQPTNTLATGLAVPIVGLTICDLCRALRPRLLRVSDPELLDAMHLLWARNGIRAEAAGAASLAGALRLESENPSRTVCIISGGNIDPIEHSTLIGLSQSAADQVG